MFKVKQKAKEKMMPVFWMFRSEIVLISVIQGCILSRPSDIAEVMLEKITHYTPVHFLAVFAEGRQDQAWQ